VNLKDAKDLVDILAGRFQAWHALWTLYQVVAVAAITVLASDKLLGSRSIPVYLSIGAGFALFAAGNYKALSDVRVQRARTCEFARTQVVGDSSSKLPSIVDSFQPPSQVQLRCFHWILDGVVVAAVVILCCIANSH